MKWMPNCPPRVYEAGYEVKVRISDCGRLHLDPDEQITLITAAGAEYDVTRKEWGFYATPSLNGRLASFGLRGVLARNRDGRVFLLLVEKGHEEAFYSYCASEPLTVLAWLDTKEAVQDLMAALQMAAPLGLPVSECAKDGLPASGTPKPECPCGGGEYAAVFVYSAPPEGEVRFPSADSCYRREVLRCGTCGHFVSRHDMDLSHLYAGEYVEATYGDAMRKVFDRITSLPPERSDNEGRARAVTDFAAAHFAERGCGAEDGGHFATGFVPRLLDVGSGLGVFPWRMRREGWACTALDPDARAVCHARDVAGVSATQADFLNDAVAGCYDVITFNKVLEHVVAPVRMLSRARTLLAPGGFVYIELPDGEMAVHDGPGREEFFIDHHHVFSMSSMMLLAAQAGFCVLHAQRLREPSGKYTLRAFMQCAVAQSATAHQREDEYYG